MKMLRKQDLIVESTERRFPPRLLSSEGFPAACPNTQRFLACGTAVKAREVAGAWVWGCPSCPAPWLGRWDRSRLPSPALPPPWAAPEAASPEQPLARWKRCERPHFDRVPANISRLLSVHNCNYQKPWKTLDTSGWAEICKQISCEILMESWNFPSSTCNGWSLHAIWLHIWCRMLGRSQVEELC